MVHHIESEIGPLGNPQRESGIPLGGITASQRRDLMEIVEDRYGAGSTLITSQLPLSTWHDVIGEPTFADAILDRIVHNAYRLELSGQSLRKTMAKTGDENCQR